MKSRILAASACLVLAGSHVPAAIEASPSAPAAPSQAAGNSRESLKVAFIGGSITEGAFSSVPANSYAALVTRWLGTRYKTVEARNTGLGGTGSEFGAYRVSHDIAGFAPDLAFIEFAVNDAGNQRPALFAHIDAIVYKLRQANPRVKIVYLSTTDIGEEADRRAGRRASWVEDSAAAAAFAGLQYIDVAAGVWAKVKAGGPRCPGVHHSACRAAARDDVQAHRAEQARYGKAGKRLIRQGLPTRHALAQVHGRGTGLRPGRQLHLRVHRHHHWLGKGRSARWRTARLHDRRRQSHDGRLLQ